MRRLLVAALAAWSFVVPAAGAQGMNGLPFSLPRMPLPIVVVDMERLLTESQYGIQVRALIADKRAALAEENRALEAELAKEVADLTERRAQMQPPDFRAEADAFDAKVQKIRADQDAKERALTALIADSEATFTNSINPLLADMMQRRGALMMLDRRVVAAVDSSLDMTDAAIEAIDGQLSAGKLLLPTIAP